MFISRLLAVITGLSLTAAQIISNNDTATIAQTCGEIKARFSNSSEVIVFRGIEYFEAIDHWIKSSEQKPVCIVQPASAQDLSVAVSSQELTHREDMLTLICRSNQSDRIVSRSQSKVEDTHPTPASQARKASTSHFRS